jgi:hypothetical protein
MITAISFALYITLKLAFNVLVFMLYAAAKTAILVAYMFQIYFQLLLIPSYTPVMLVLGIVMLTIKNHPPARAAFINFTYDLVGYAQEYMYSLLDYFVLTPIMSVASIIGNYIVTKVNEAKEAANTTIVNISVNISTAFNATCDYAWNAPATTTNAASNVASAAFNGASDAAYRSANVAFETASNFSAWFQSS